MSRRIALLAGLLVASLGLTWTFLWWAAWLFTDWQLTLNFNGRGEQWAEGVLLHAVAMFGLWLAIKATKGEVTK